MIAIGASSLPAARRTGNLTLITDAIVHSVIHLSYNHVIHRLLAFALSNFVLVTLWILTALRIF